MKLRFASGVGLKWPVAVRSKFFGVKDVVASVQRAAASSQYRDNPVLITMKVLEAAGLLTLILPDEIGADKDDPTLHDL